MSSAVTVGKAVSQHYRIKSGRQGVFLVPTGGITYTCGTGAGSNGSWTQMTSSLNVGGADGLLVAVHAYYGGANISWSTSIGIGGAGAEQTICEFVYAGASAPGPVEHVLPFPILIPGGSRIAARGWAGSGTPTVSCWVSIIPIDALEAF